MKLAAERREPGKSGALRQSGRIPGVMYNNKLNVPLSVELREFDKAFRAQGQSNVITIDIAGESHDVLVKAVQMDKRRREPIHVDFFALTAGQVVDVAVTVDFVGTPAGVKGGGQVDIQRREIRVKILPRLIPGSIEVDISDMEVNDSLHIADVKGKLPAEAELLDDEGLTLVAVVPPRIVAEPEDAADELEEPEVIGEAGEGEEGDESAGEETTEEE